MHRVKANLLQNVIAIGLTVLAGLISIPILTRTLSPNTFGHVSLILIFLNLFTLLEGTRQVFIKFYHKWKEVEKRKEFLRTSWVLSWMSSILGTMVVLLILTFLFDSLSIIEIIFLSLSAGLYLLMSNPWAQLEAEEKVGLAALVRAIVWVLVYVSFIIYSLYGAPIEFYALSLMLMNGLLLVLYSGLQQKRQNYSSKTNWGMFREMVNEIKSVILFNFWVAVMNFSDRLIISRILPITDLGYYTAQYELGVRGNGLANTACTVLFPTFSLSVEKKGVYAAVPLWLSISKWLFLTIYLFTLIGFGFSKEIIELYAGAPYAGYNYIFKIVMIGVAINTLGFMAVLLQRADCDFTSQGMAYCIGAVIGIVLAYPLIKTLGLLGGALTYLIMRIADLILIWQVRQKYFRRGSGINLKNTSLVMLFILCYVLALLSQYWMIASFLVFSWLLIDADDFRIIKNTLGVRYSDAWF